MLSLGPLSFAVPWALALIAALPIIWWVLRLTPPQPKKIWFPPFRFVANLGTDEQAAYQTPPWLILLRLLIGLLLIVGIAHPLLYQNKDLSGFGPVYIIVDDGWGAADDWPARKEVLSSLVDQVERQGRVIVLVTTAPVAGSALSKPELLSPDRARELSEGLQPKPWSTEREQAIDNLLSSTILTSQRPGDVVWLSDGVASDDQQMANLTAKLQGLGGVTVYRPTGEQLPLVLRTPVSQGSQFKMIIERAEGESKLPVKISGFAASGVVIMSESTEFGEGELSAEITVELPIELRNRLSRLVVKGRHTAASIVLLDGQWQRRPVGILSGAEASKQPLLNPEYYVERALAPFSEIRKHQLDDLLKRPLSMIVLPDTYLLEPSDNVRLNEWMKEGGTLVRFAGPQLAQFQEQPDDNLLPVPLRGGERAIGGSMSWRQPQKLAPFPENSPYVGLAIPDDVTVTRQILAEPFADLPDRTWAQLTDGTPLVTATRRGQGWLVLFHTTANADWSNLALSGLFVDLMKRTTELGKGVENPALKKVLPPLQTLAGNGVLGKPSAHAKALRTELIEQTRPSAEHPPGYYGDQQHRIAFNLSSNLASLQPIGDLPMGVALTGYEQSPELDLKPWLLLAVLILFLIDYLISLSLRGHLNFRFGISILFASVLLGHPNPSVADQASDLENSNQSRLAYVVSGDEEVDVISHNGLSGLSLIMKRRTTIELAEPVGVNLELDELAFFPLIYWPLTSATSVVSPQAVSNIRHYLSSGGIILFDDRDPVTSDYDSLLAMRELADKLKLPSLVPIPSDHVLGRSFYLLRDFPGRWEGRPVWIQRSDARINDGVSSVIAGSHDWAGAWALDEYQQPMLPVVPGGERQREFAYRFGINLVMYVMTGNYKEDQVHLPEIMKRLGK